MTKPGSRPNADGHLAALNRDIEACRRCPRLIDHCQTVAETRRRAYREWEYWGKPVPSFGDPRARLLILGLAPGAHGANRTGRMFTGDRSGDFLYPALYRAGFASQPESRTKDDGLTLRNAWITAAAHCAPPDNKPLPEELAACRPWLEREVELLREVRVVLALGRIGFETWLGLLKKQGQIARISDYRFAHGALFTGLRPALLCSYHPSQQNTSTGRLTEAMLDDVLGVAARLVLA